ncbi:MAG: type VI secretion system baseplate subunit TssG [Polyangiaceae bacterium]
MAGTQRELDDDLRAELEADAEKYSFFQAVQLIVRLHRGAAPVGGAGPPSREAIRFRHDPSLVFHSSDVSAIRLRVPRQGLLFSEITSTFLGLSGTVSPLTAGAAERIARDADEGGSLRDFYDIFHHRLLGLLFRAWKRSRLYASHRMDGTDAMTRRALAFVGVDAFGAGTRLGLPPIDLLSLAPLLSFHTRSARTLGVVLQRVFPDIGVDVESFLERRVMLSDDQRAQLGLRNGTLGTNFTIGRSVVDRSGRFGVRIGPVDYSLFEALLPGGQHHTKLREIVQQFTRGVLEAEVEVELAPDQSPAFKLGSKGAQLGVTTTLRTDAKPLKARFVLSDDVESVRATMVS